MTSYKRLFTLKQYLIKGPAWMPLQTGSIRPLAVQFHPRQSPPSNISDLYLLLLERWCFFLENVGLVNHGGLTMKRMKMPYTP